MFDGDSWHVGPELADAIVKSGFSVNASKVRMQYEDSQQVVTGLVVNDKAYFAEHVVKANAATIDFSGFDTLLDRLRQVIAHYATVPK